VGKRPEKAAYPPGTRPGWFGFTILADFRKDPLEQLDRLHREYGESNLQRGWVNVHLARRTALANSKDIPKANHVAISLRHELGKITGWRSKAISDLICDKDGRLRSIDSDEVILRLANAVWLRDDYANNSYFKILLRRRHLLTLFLLLVLAILGCLFIWPVDFLPKHLHGIRGRLLIVLSGILGASISVAQNLLSTDISAKIPAQQIGSFLTWMRPAIGAASALIAVALFEAGKTMLFDASLVQNPGAILAIAFAAGFSERFITQAIERASERSDMR
jgi:hypothetical protein